MNAMTQQNRPTIREAAYEALLSTDLHWTSNLSRMGMTRISRYVVLNTYSISYATTQKGF